MLDPSETFSGVCLFVDHASSFMSIKHQVAVNVIETVKAKQTFNRDDQNQGAEIKGYHTDNRVFNAPNFIECLLNMHKNIQFCVSGASHQNGAAESAIKTLVTMGKTMLIHTVIRFIEENFPTDICSMAIQYDVCIYNQIHEIHPGLSAIEICSKLRFDLV